MEPCVCHLMDSGLYGLALAHALLYGNPVVCGMEISLCLPFCIFIGNGNRGNLRNGHSVLVKHDFSRYRIKFLLFFLNLVRCRSKDTDTLFPFLNIPVKIFLLSLESGH